MQITIFQCPFKLLFGMSCPGCGMTRAMLSALQLKFEQAFYYHPLFPLLFIGAIWWILEYFGLVKLPVKVRKTAAILLVGSFFVTYIIRFFTTPEIVFFQPQEGLLYKIFANIS